MKKRIFGAFLSVVLAGTMGLSVAASGNETKTQDFLLRGNEWGMTFSEVSDTGEYAGDFINDYTQHHEKQYIADISGYEYDIFYVFDNNGRLYSVCFSPVSTDVSAYKSLLSELKKNYGEPSYSMSDDYSEMQTWSTQSGELMLSYFDGGVGTICAYTASTYNADTKELAAYAEFCFEEIFPE